MKKFILSILLSMCICISAYAKNTNTIRQLNKNQITIYLNRLQDSVLTINLTSGNTTNEIISTLEYILNTNKG